MPNYLTTIDEKLAQLRIEIAELETARKVLERLQEAPAPVAPRTVLVKIPKPGKYAYGGTQVLKKVRAKIPEILSGQLMTSREIIEKIRVSVNASDSTIWKALKELRDEGILAWNEETRIYSLFRKPQLEAAS